MIKLYRKLDGSALIKACPAYKTGFLYSEDWGANWNQLSRWIGHECLSSGAFVLLANNFKRKR